jgi:hypothetical protein
VRRLASVGLALGMLGSVLLAMTACDPPLSEVRVQNDSGQPVTILWCDDTACLQPKYTQTLEPGATKAGSGHTFLVKVLDQSGSVLGCLQYDQGTNARVTTTVAVSGTQPCPSPGG